MRTFLLSSSLIWLTLAQPTHASEAYRYIPDQSGWPQGGIILRYPQVVESVATRISHVLSDHGWSVLLVPTIHTISPPQAPIEADQLVRYMTGTKGQFNLVMMVIGDNWDAQLNLEDPEPADDRLNPIQGVVLIDVEGEVIAPAELPVLDISTVLQSHPSYVQRRADARKKRYRKQKGLNLNHYSTRALHNGESLLDRRIRGWLYHHVKGMELSSVAQ